MRLFEKLQPFVDAAYPLLYVNTYEELKVDEALSEFKKEGKKVAVWSEGDLRESVVEFLDGFANGLEDLDEVLIVLKDIHPYLDEKSSDYSKVVALLKKLSLKILNDEKVTANVILVSPVMVVPKELEKFLTIFEVPLPSFKEIKEMIEEFMQEYDEELGDKELDEFCSSLKGLTQTEIELLLNMIYANGEFGGKRARELALKEKKEIIKKGQILELVDSDIELDNVGGLKNLKRWLTKKAKVFLDIKKAKEFGVDTPKGVFIVGMPGCGKSLTAKATAKLFGDIPLLRLDIGKIMGKYVGESESNLRKAISQAEAIAPCILWIDEIEKAFMGVGKSAGSEVTTRLFGNFLTWMQEKSSEVYVVATANDISNLPPELLRKGRFDEVFFVDFPNESEREQIFKVHIQKRGHSLDSVDLKELAKESNGFSGADIETVVKETIESAFIDKKESIVTNDYVASLKETTSISQMLKEQIEYYEKLKNKLKMKKAS